MRSGARPVVTEEQQAFFGVIARVYPATIIAYTARLNARPFIMRPSEPAVTRAQLEADWLRQEVVRLSLLATHQVVSTSLDENAQRKLVTEFLAQADTLGKN